ASPNSCTSNIGENSHAFLITPVVQDQFERIGVGRRHFAEHVTADIAAPIGKTKPRGPTPVSLSNNLGTIKDNRAEMRVSFEETTSEMAVPTGYIAKCTDAGQIEVRKRGNDHFGLHRRVARHGLVEHLAIPMHRRWRNRMPSSQTR